MMEWGDFLNPRSMLTPGIAGSIVMVIANTLWVQFMLPQKWTALTLSFMLLLPILVKFSASFVESLIYFVLNGLIIFSLAVNANFAGGKLQAFSASEIKSITAQDTSAGSTTSQITSALSSGDHHDDIHPVFNTQLALNDQHTNSPSQDKNQNTKTHNENSNTNSQKQKKNTSGSTGGKQFFDKWF